MNETHADQRRAFSEKNRHTTSLAEKVWLCGPFAGHSTTSALGSPPGQGGSKHVYEACRSVWMELEASKTKS